MAKKKQTLNAYMRSKGYDPKDMPSKKLSKDEMKRYPITREMLNYKKKHK